MKKLFALVAVIAMLGFGAYQNAFALGESAGTSTYELVSLAQDAAADASSEEGREIHKQIKAK